MEASGHMPNLSRTGNIIGYKSRPGAPQSPRETMPVSEIGGNGVAVPYGMRGHDAAWNAWFHPAAAPTAPAQPPSIDPNDDSRMPSLPASPAAHIGAAAASHSAWLGANGIAFPPPPAGLSQPTTNPMQFPNMANDPAQNKSAFVTPAGVDPGYVSSVQAFNTNLYKPADTQPINTQAPPVNPDVSPWNRTGWNAPTQNDSAAIASKFGQASMNNWLSSVPTMN